jgi:hypothetical protein
MINVNIQDGDINDIAIAATVEDTRVRVNDNDIVRIDISDNSSNSTLLIDENGQLIEVEVTTNTDTTELNIGELGQVVIVVDDSKKAPGLDDLNVTVNTAGGPAAGTNFFNLPAGWNGKRIRVFRNGIKFFNWVRTTAGIELTVPGDVWMGDPGFEETISIENY